MGKRICKVVRGSKVSALGLGGLFALLLMAAESKAELKVTFSAGVSADQKSLLEGDFKLLQNLKLADPTGEAQRLMKLDEVSAASFEKWVSKRVRFIIDEKHPVTAPNAYEVSKAEYPTEALAQLSASETPNYRSEFLRAGPGVGFNQVVSSSAGGDSKTTTEPASGQPNLSNSKNNEVSSESGRQSGPTVVMGNAGAMLYAQGRLNRILVGLKIDGGPTIAIKSPRVGLLQVGAGLFMRIHEEKRPGDLDNFIHSVHRLYTLFHEARHSDGRGDKLGMLHAICPMGHDYAGFGACDKSSNGSYRMGALMLKATIDGCGAECETKDKEIMTLLYADSMHRLLSPPQEAAVEPENSMCNQLRKIRHDVPFCQTPILGRPIARTVIEWDDEPEYVISKPQIDPMATSSIGKHVMGSR